MALDLRRDLYSLDIGNVLRAGTTAVRTAMDAIVAGSAHQVLVVAADTRMAAPRGDQERNLGDGAAALLLAKEGIATIQGSNFITEHMLDSWRTQGDTYVRSWEERFIAEEGYERILEETIRGLMEKYQLTSADFAKAAFYGPDVRRHSAMGRRLGFREEQIQDPLFGQVGNTGAAHSLMLLTGALEQARVGDLLLLAGYRDGGDAFIIRVGRGISRLQDGRGVTRYVESKQVLPNYETYVRWRDAMTTEAARRPPAPMPSVSAMWRERDQNIRLYGSRCNQCGYLQYPPQRVCTKCQAKDNATPMRLSDKRGEVFTYAMDYLAGTVDVPLVVTVVNFEGGGRMIAMMTDREPDDVHVGMPVEMSFRCLRTVGGVHNYYWKSVPVRASLDGTEERTGGGERRSRAKTPPKRA